jgi:hypothetical protein
VSEPARDRLSSSCCCRLTLTSTGIPIARHFTAQKACASLLLFASLMLKRNLQATASAMAAQRSTPEAGKLAYSGALAPLDDGHYPDLWRRRAKVRQLGIRQCHRVRDQANQCSRQRSDVRLRSRH